MDVSDEIRTEHLPDINPEIYRYDMSLDSKNAISLDRSGCGLLNALSHCSAAGTEENHGNINQESHNLGPDCNKHKGTRNYDFVGSEDLDVDGRIILKWITKKQVQRV
jgi:hypothetical protein